MSSAACSATGAPIPGLSLVYVHLNRLIKKYDLDVIFIAGPGHGAPAVIANVYLEGTYSEIYSDVSEDAEGLRRLFRQFSFPGGIGSHCTPETPGSIHEGGELGYSPVARLRRGVRQPGSHRRRHGRRRRSGNRAAGDRLAFEQVSQSGSRRRRAAGVAFERLQDRQSDDPRPHSARGTGAPVPRLWLRSVLRRGIRPRHDAPGARRHPRTLRSRNSSDSARGARRRPRRSGPGGR